MGLEEGPFIFRVNDNGSGPNLLIQVCQERGWVEFNVETFQNNNWNLWWKTQAFPVLHQKPLLEWQVCMERGWREYADINSMKDSWNLWWKTSAFSVSQHKHLKAWQFTNHIPKGASICRKDNLARNLKCMKKVYGTIYDISPDGYNLPLEYTKLVADCSRRDHCTEEEKNQKVWICKPVGQSQGRGIFLFKSLSDLCYDSNAVVQRYIKNPLLIGGYKFDLRLYVCVPSYHPLTIYLYKEGLVRFSTDKFSLSDLNNPFCHLTNSSLNKLGPGYAEQKDRVGAGCKWSFKQLRQYFQQAGIRDWLLWQRISALVTLTILSQSTSVPQTTNCFEFYGFDVLIDDNLKPWLLEVNLSPALGNDCDVDPVVKKPLLHDLFDLLGLPVCYTGLSLFRLFSPLDPKNQFFNINYNSPEENQDSEQRHSNPVRLKQKQTKSATCIRSSSFRGVNPPKQSTASAMIVVNAANKWRRKRKSHYLFGPPQKSNMTLIKIKSTKENNKSPIILPESKSNNTLDSNKIRDGKNKDQPTVDGAQETGTIGDIKVEKKITRNGKRNRDGQDRIKTSMSATAFQKEKNQEHFLVKAVSCSDNFKEFLKGEKNTIDSKSKKKKIIDQKQFKAKGDQKKSLSVEKQKKGNTDHKEKIKSVFFPFEKSNLSKGFKGKTKSHSPLLWGNGRDWRTPINREGDWGRIYPLTDFNIKYNPSFEEDYLGNKFTVGDKQIRLVVHHMTNFIKICKQIYFKGINSSEEELNTQLINNIGMTSDVWLPCK